MRQDKTDIHIILEKSCILDNNDINFFLTNRKILMEDMNYLSLDSVFPEVKELLSDLSKDFDIYILTIRHNRLNTEVQLRILGIDQYNIIIVEGNKEQEMMLIPNLRFMVGDTENDILPANKLGVSTIAVTTGIRNRHHLIELNPEYLIDNIEEVKDIVYGK